MITADEFLKWLEVFNITPGGGGGGGGGAGIGYYVSTANGNDTSGTGSPTKPYATVAKAMSVVSGNTETTPVTIYFSGYDTSNFNIKPSVALIGSYNGALLTGGISLDPSWQGKNATFTFSNIFHVASIDLQNSGYTNATTININVINSSLNAFETLNYGHTTATLNLNSSIVQSINVNDWLVNSYNSDIESLSISNSNFVTGIQSCNFYGGKIGDGDIFLAGNTGINTLTFYFANVNIVGSPTVSQANVVYDGDSYPQEGFTLESGGVAYPLVNSSYAPPQRTVTGDDNINSYDETIFVNASSAVALTLIPAGQPIVPGQFWYVTGISGTESLNNVTITPNSGTINGQASYVGALDRFSIRIQTDGTNFYIQ